MTESSIGGCRKSGRGAKSPARAAYKASMRWVTNKLKKLTKHIKNHPNDIYAATQLKGIQTTGKGTVPNYLNGRRDKLTTYVRANPWDAKAKVELERLR